MRSLAKFPSAGPRKMAAYMMCIMLITISETVRPIILSPFAMIVTDAQTLIEIIGGVISRPAPPSPNLRPSHDR